MRLKRLSGNILRVSVGVAFVLTAAATTARANSGGDPNCHATNSCDGGGGNLTAPVGDVPEISLGALGGAMTLLSGGLFVVTSKLRRKK